MAPDFSLREAGQEGQGLGSFSCLFGSRDSFTGQRRRRARATLLPGIRGSQMLPFPERFPFSPWQRGATPASPGTCPGCKRNVSLRVVRVRGGGRLVLPGPAA